MIIVKFEWTFPDSVIFLPHSYLVIAVWLFCCRHSGKADRMEDDFCMENNFLSLIKTRRSVRAYKAEPVPPEALDAVLEAGTYAPTGGGRQSPTIIAITDPKYRQEIARLNAEVMGNNTDPYYGAPAVVLVLADGGASTFVEDGSCVLENMMLAAHALGLGTVWVHREREIFDSESGKALLREWKLPETLRGVGAIALGYPAQEAGQPAVRKQNYIVRI
jgi:nitroreductase